MILVPSKTTIYLPLRLSAGAGSKHLYLGVPPCGVGLQQKYSCCPDASSVDLRLHRACTCERNGLLSNATAQGKVLPARLDKLTLTASVSSRHDAHRIEYFESYGTHRAA